MTVLTGTRQAFGRESFGGFAADRTSLWEAWLYFWNCFAVNFRVTRSADSHPVINVKHQFRVIGNVFYMVCVNGCVSCAAFLASVIISLINSITPFLYAAASEGAKVCKRLAAFPVWRPLPFSRTGSASMRAEFRTPVGAFKCFTAMSTGERYKRIHCGVLALLGAVFSPCKSKRLYGKNFSTLLTGDIVHSNIISYLSFIRAAVPSLERMSTAFPDLPIRRIE